METTAPYVAKLEAEKSASVAQLLMQCARLWNGRGLAAMAARTGIPVREAHTRLFPHIDLAGTRATAIAERAGISKQAVGRLLEDLEGWDIVERLPDPADGRAQIVRWSAAGRRGLLEGLALLQAQEAEIRERLGAAELEALRRLLLDLREILRDTCDPV